MRPIALGLLALAVCGCNADAQSRGAEGAIRILAQPVPLNARDPGQTRTGHFTYVGGLDLRSPDTGRLGGLSDLKIDANGTLVSETDEGDLLRARLRMDAGRLAGLDNATIEPLQGLDGHAVRGKRESDAEGVAVWPNGDLMVSFERDHRIWVYPSRGGPPHPVPHPDTYMPNNSGMEGLALAPSHGADAYWVGIEGGSIWLCRVASGCAQDKGEVRPPFGYRLSGLAETAAGDLVVLHHGYDPIRGSRAIVWITRPGLGAPAKVIDRLVLAPPLATDFFEGVDTAPLPGGGLRLFLISDNNFSVRQRSLFLAFDWSPKPQETP